MEPLLVAFGVVFVAELGDKTQLVALGLGARYRMRLVIVGVAIAQAVAMGLSVLVGGVVGAALPERVLGVAAALAFFGFAVWTLRSGDSDDEPGVASDGENRRAEGGETGARSSDDAPLRRSAFVVASIAVAVFVAELGDKTMLAAATLATRQDLVLTWIGATAGVVLAGVVAVVVGNALGSRLPETLVRRIAAGLFALFGVILLVDVLRA